MNLREKFAAQSPGAKTLGIVAAICTVFPAIAIAFVVYFVIAARINEHRP